MQLKVRHVVVGLHSKGMDTIWFDLEVPSACPIMGYPPRAKMEAQAGFGVQWVRQVFGIEPEIINLG